MAKPYYTPARIGWLLAHYRELSDSQWPERKQVPYLPQVTGRSQPTRNWTNIADVKADIDTAIKAVGPQAWLLLLLQVGNINRAEAAQWLGYHYNSIGRWRAMLLRRMSRCLRHG